MNIKIPEHWGVNREQMVDALSRDWADNIDLTKDDLYYMARYGEEIPGFEYYADDKLIKNYAVIRDEYTEVCLSCHSIMVKDENFEKFRCVNRDCNKTI